MKSMMWRKTFQIFLTTLVAVVAVGGGSIYFFRHLSQPEFRPGVIPPSTSEIPAEVTLSDHETPAASSPEARSIKKAWSDSEIREKFFREGWSTGAADEFLRLNRDWFALLRRVDPLAYTKQLTLLAALGNHRDLMDFIEKNPESGALFTVTENPVTLLRLFESAGNNYDFLVNLYVIHSATVDNEPLTETLSHDGDLIAGLYRRGLAGSEAIFFFDHGGEGGHEYDRWLREILTARLDNSDAELASLLNLVLRYGPDIRRRLRRDDSFRQSFRATIWPRLVRVAAANHEMFELYLGDPRIWDLLAMPEGEELLRLRGLLPIDLLYGYPELGHSPYPSDLHGMVIKALLQGDEETIRALIKFRDEPLFYDLARRNVSDGAKNAVFRKLFKAGDDYRKLLGRYINMTDQGLVAEVGPPPNLLKTWTPLYYTLWEVPRKLSQGRDPSSGDWLNCLADPASFLYPILKIGVAVVNVGNTLRDIGEDERNTPGFKETSLKIAGQQLGEELAAKLGDRELLPFGVTGMLIRMQEAYRDKMSPAAIVDTTGPVRFMLGYSGTSQSSLESLKMIEGRYLLRGDGRMIVRPGNDEAKGEVIKYLTASSSDFAYAPPAANPDGRTPASDEIPRQTASDHLDAWRRNVTGWWLMQASGMLRRTANKNTLEPGRQSYRWTPSG